MLVRIIGDTGRRDGRSLPVGLLINLPDHEAGALIEDGVAIPLASAAIQREIRTLRIV